MYIFEYNTFATTGTSMTKAFENSIFKVGINAYEK